MKRSLYAALVTALPLLLAASPVAAAIITFNLGMDGAQEVPSGTGDPDGSAFGTLSLNDVTGQISWSITYANIEDPVAMHIHPGAMGSEGGPLVTLTVVANGPDPNPLVGSVTPFLTTTQSIIANPLDFYVNIHTASFPDGAVRGQVPEPGAALLVGAGLVALALSSRRACRSQRRA